MPRSKFLPVLFSLSLCSITFAQNDHKPDEQPAATPAAQPDGPKPSDASPWPAIPKKKLWAEKDFRGKKAPAFKVESWLTKEPDRKDKVILIDFWATWCPPCRELCPELEQWQAKFKDDLVIIGISDEAKDKVEPFAQQQKLTYAMAIDSKKTMNKAIGVQGIPHVLVISSDGVVRWQGYPQSEEERLTEETLKKIIDADKTERAKRDAAIASPKKTGA